MNERLKSVASRFGPESEYRMNKIYLGTAEDGLPVSINLDDFKKGPRLIVAEKGNKNSKILQSIAKSIIVTQTPENVQFVVITPNPNEWERPGYSEHCPGGIIPVFENDANDIILSLGDWAHSNKSGKSVVLLYEDLTRILSSNPETVDDIRWLLMRGTAGGVFPIVTLDSSKTREVSSWLPYFRSRIFGKITDQKEAIKVIEADKLKDANLDTLSPDSQFTTYNGKEWVRFSIKWKEPVNI